MARILLIEADRLLGTNAKNVLKRAGHKVAVRVDPQAALDSAEAAKPDIIILDLLLAGRSGPEFLYEFRSYPDWLDIPVIIYSDLPSEEASLTGVGFSGLNIAAYCQKSSTSLGRLSRIIEQVLPSAVR